MAHALAAMSPPLKPSDVERAADRLTLLAGQPQIVDGLLRRNVHLMKARRIVEALGALRELAT